MWSLGVFNILVAKLQDSQGDSYRHFQMEQLTYKEVVYICSNTHEYIRPQQQYVVIVPARGDCLQKIFDEGKMKKEL
ncbi:hypothetical protein chiPu_0006014 [Chiloscyllium punctatum]|uniref:Uncharacterized protein n=1 Tax=Chiloscyllium punctatum TaxID=137246 RepID=A0A401SB16_CHIPU|nr:hypothetical protein [Chiloscyllium punctatum]